MSNPKPTGAMAGGFEAQTDYIVRRKLEDELGFTDERVTIHPQGANPLMQTNNHLIWQVQQGASKSGGGVGKPEYVIEIAGHDRLVVVIEDKGPKIRHEGPHQDITDIEQRMELHPNDIVRYAVDGVLWYAKKFSREYDVIAIAVSGTEEPLRVSSFIHRRGQENAEPLAYPNAGRTPINSLIDLDTYITASEYNPQAILDASRQVGEVVKLLEDTTKKLGLGIERSLTMSALVAALQIEGTFDMVLNADGFEAKRDVILAQLRARYEELEQDPREEGGGEEE